LLDSTRFTPKYIHLETDMYLPAHFEETRPAELHALLRSHPLGLLITQDDQGAPVANPIPFMLDAARGPCGTLVGHVARANPVWRVAAGGPALVVFQAPNGYVSPNGYASKAEHGKVVPTWNYAVVQARGPLQVLDEAAAARALVTRLTERHEATQPRPWAVGDAPDDYIASMLRAIVCIEIPLVSLVGKFKLSQNRSAADQAGVVATLQAGADSGDHALARWMQAQGAPDA
jgi:transcriptional regulator